MQILELENLSIGYSQILIEKINLCVKSPKVISLMGKNGIGKSCLLKTLAGLNLPLSGKVHLNHKSIFEFSSEELAKNISVLLTDKINLEYLTVKELIMLGRSPYSNWNNDYSQFDYEVYDEAVELLHIKNIEEKFFSQLSDGQKQKALLAKALVQSPKILVLDEPTTFLDIPSKIEFLHLLKRISHDKNIIIIMSTHETIHFKEIVDEVWLVDNKGLKNYTPEEIITSGVFKAMFGLDLS